MEDVKETMELYFLKKERREKYQPNPLIFMEPPKSIQFRTPKGRKVRKSENITVDKELTCYQKEEVTTHYTQCDQDTLDSGSLHIRGIDTPKTINSPKSRSLSLKSLKNVSNLQKREPERTQKFQLQESIEANESQDCLKTPSKKKKFPNLMKGASRTSENPVSTMHEDTSPKQTRPAESLANVTPYTKCEPESLQSSNEVCDLFDGIHRNLIPNLRSHLETRRLLESNYNVPMCYQDLLESFHNIEIALFTLISRKEKTSFRKVRDWIFSQYRM